MSKLVWDTTGDRTYETGLNHGVDKCLLKTVLSRRQMRKDNSLLPFSTSRNIIYRTMMGEQWKYTSWF